MKWEPTDEHIMCRDLQHSWAPDTARSTRTGFERTLRCTRCDARKRQRLDRGGYILSTSMAYPPGYLRPGKGRVTPDDRAGFRLWNIDHTDHVFTETEVLEGES